MAQKKSETNPATKIKREVRLVPDPNFVFSYPRFYSNVATIQSTPFDFTIRFCEALPIYEKPKGIKEGEAIESKMAIKAEIVIPKEVYPVLIKAMQEHYDKYLKAHGGATKDEEKK